MNDAELIARGKAHGCTARQSKFAAEYLKTGNGTKSAVKAGFSPASARNQAYRMTTNDDVLDLQAELAAELEAIKHLDGNTVLAGLLKMANSADQDGTKVRAWELLGKAKRLFVERIETDSPAQGLEDQIKASLPPEQALAVLQALGLVAPETETPDDAGN